MNYVKAKENRNNYKRAIFVTLRIRRTTGKHRFPPGKSSLIFRVMAREIVQLPVCFCLMSGFDAFQKRVEKTLDQEN